jgi:hypothetical protein
MTVTSARPRLRWTGLPGVKLQVCSDRTCEHVLSEFAGSDEEAAPPRDLPPGYWFWRARAASRSAPWTPAWVFRIRRHPANRVPAANTAVDPFADYNGDGFPDVAVLTSGTEIRVYFGGVDGLSPDRVVRMTISDTGGPGGALVTPGIDLNGDGFADLVTVRDVVGDAGEAADHFASIAFGNPGGFAPATAVATIIENYPLGVLMPVAIGDFDGDGFGDLAVPLRSGTILMAGCHGDAAAVPLGTSLACGDCGLMQVGAGDLDGDGKTDVVNGDGSSIHLYLGGPEPSSPITVAGHSGFLLLDVNQDGYSDLAPPMGYAATAPRQLFLGGASGLATEPRPLAEPSDLTPYLVGDFNGDGEWDVVEWNTCGGSCDLHFGTAYGPVLDTNDRTSADTSLTTSGQIGSALVADVNADDYDDLLVSDQNGRQLSVFLGSATGLAASPSRIFAF